ncbi:MAG: RNA 2',3'-cyclic phosphodiesterase [Candidatus Aenigmarchaeota archaeon]|nr:RNA 2',3'-cyclic phosphodiesterase [Candidatus Aenigmarchaeota archaeon]
MRSFIAIDIDKSVRKKIVKIQEEIGKAGKMKFVAPENLHLTLKFLGDISSEQCKNVKNELKFIAKQIEPFRININGVGAFPPSQSYIRVIWLGIKEGYEDMKELLEKINKIELGKRADVPHLTIARVKMVYNKELLVKKIKSLSNVEVGYIDIKNIKLKKSVLTSTGPIYKDLSVVKLGE